MMTKQAFLESVMENIRSKEAKKIVTKELEQHIRHNTDHFLKEGHSVSAAEQKTVEQMGSPLTLGAKFNKLYKPKMDWVLAGLFFLALGLGVVPFIVLKDSFYPLN